MNNLHPNRLLNRKEAADFLGVKNLLPSGNQRKGIIFLLLKSEDLPSIVMAIFSSLSIDRRLISQPKTFFK